tara:strand:+ start:50679 stop:50990 length:312 start_codon:yes stop_codon:yes gene_type:complete
MARNDPPQPAGGFWILVGTLGTLAFAGAVVLAVLAGAFRDTREDREASAPQVDRGAACIAQGNALTDCALMCELTAAPASLFATNAAHTCKQTAARALMAERP